MKEFIVTFLACSLILVCATKPKLRVGGDGFPIGQDTPEGAATELARTFIDSNALEFRYVCIRPYGDGPSRADYTNYLDDVSRHMKPGSTALPDNPKKIKKVFAARHLSKNGPASYGYATFDFQDIMFVDVEVVLHNGTTLLRRTMVIKDRDGKWYTHPVPDISPLLSDGIYDESASVHLFADVYEVVPRFR